MIPGDVVQLMLEEKAYGKDLEDLRAKLGLNRPIVVQYVEWVSKVVRGDLGESLWTKRPVIEELARRLPISLELGVLALLFALIVMALPDRGHRGHPPGHHRRLCRAQHGHPRPLRAGLLDRHARRPPPRHLVGLEPAHPVHRDLGEPVGALRPVPAPRRHPRLASAAAIMRLTRAMLLDVLRQDYVRTAWSKGLRERVVVLKHSLKNAVIPVVTVLGIQVAQILGGTVIFEQIFGLPGMGRFLFDAINQRDYPVIQGINLLIVTVVVVMNLVVDATYALLDPRIRY